MTACIVIGERVYECLRDACEAHGRKVESVRRRMRRGMSVEEALRGRRNRFRRGELAALAASTGVTTHTLSDRLKRGMTIEQASAPRATISGMARAVGMDPAQAHRRMNRGASLEEALTPCCPAELLAAVMRARPRSPRIAKLVSGGMTRAEALTHEAERALERMGRAA